LPSPPDRASAGQAYDELHGILAALSARPPAQGNAGRALLRHNRRTLRYRRFDRPAGLLADIFLGYGIALASHRLGDRSTSLVLVNPIWGAIADFRMCWLALTGGLSAELTRHVGPSADPVDGSLIQSSR
jgi:hypothetical protein